MAQAKSTYPLDTQSPTSKRLEILVGLFFLILYLLNRSPYAGWNDALGFLADGAQGCSPYTNATSHFLYNNLLHALSQIVFFASPVLIGTLFSVLCALLCLKRLHQLALFLSGNRTIALLPTILLGLAFSFWQQAEGIEVYAFNNLLFIHYFAWAIMDLHQGTRQRLLWVALTLGLALLTHIQHLLSLPFFILYLSTGTAPLPRRLAALTTTLALFSILIILPLTTHTHSIRAVFFDNRFQDDVMGLDLTVILKGILKGIGYLLYNFHIYTLLILLGIWTMWKKARTFLAWLALLALPYLGFAAKYSVNDNHVFFLLPYIILMIPVVYAGKTLHLRWQHRTTWLYPLMLIFPILLYASLWLAAHQIPALSTYNTEKAYKGGLAHLLWPGKAWAKDPLTAAKQIYHTDPTAFQRGDIEWNYPDAIRYLKAKGQL